jgi:hypothetical protein
MDTTGSGLELAAQLEWFRRETLARRERAKRIPWEETPQGAWFAAHAEEWANDDPNSPENQAAIARAKRLSRRVMRAEARRMTLQKYQAQLRRTSELKRVAGDRDVRRRSFMAAAQPTTPTPRARSRRHRPASRARARALGREDPEPLASPLAADVRRWLRNTVSQARSAQAAKLDTWRECRRCLREQEPEEFGDGCSYCRSCESQRVSAYKRATREAVTA